jgi:hypothetical protein
VPDENSIWTRLSCKNCERPLLSIWKRETAFGNTYYKVFDLARNCYILGNDKNSVKRDAFWGWVSDHGGDRYE